ncbi:vesicle-associated membrane protein/synaptobrevin-binding protein [Toxorhynchites rutilus septentrionalis]|uniref:vesicle-associated membrane protein/synaptobrevin-binding protein n=1 Tax=Toxorhynchites rutilus septentrionalis TaxID=329112 RepID=UPI0024797F82|nr:vesicle-associated membrane protein/synaptobrevin-binding protein [Toxorhynchites rutilus septentrionalis]
MSNKNPQVLIIDPPNELKFVGPFTAAVSSYMRLSNPTDKPILFKIKTTAPKKYCVRPNWGVLEPNDSIEITIILQPFIFDAAEKNKHKFMVQSMFYPAGGQLVMEDLWKNVNPDNLMDSKLRCVFELPVDNNQTAPGTTAAATSTVTSQSANATPNKNESGVSATDSQHGSNTSNEEEKLSDTSLMQEVKKLREAESALRHENLLLKERLLRMRLDMENSAKEQQQQSVSSGLGMSVSGSSSTSSGQTAAAAAQMLNNPYSPPQLAAGQQIPIVYVAAAIAMAIFGLIIGKFLL